MQNQTGFGRKGATDASMAQKRAAFIASERQNAFAGGPQPGAMRDALKTQTLRSAAVGGSMTDAGITPEQARAAMGIQASSRPEKSLMLAYVLWFFACAVSAHRFYLGAVQSALVQMGFYLGGWVIIYLSLGTKQWGSSFYLGAFLVMIGSVWMLIDLFLIPGIRNRMDRKYRAEEFNTVFS